MIEVNWCCFKSLSKIESITAIYMSNKFRLLKTEHIQSNIHQPLFIPCWSYTVFTHVQRNLIQENQRVKSLNTPRPSICLANVSNFTGSRLSSSFLPSLERLKEEICPEMTRPIILSLELRGYGWPTMSPNFDAREQKATKTIFLRQSNIVQSSVDVLQYRQAF